MQGIRMSDTGDRPSEVDHPAHYSGQGPVECIQVLEMLAASGHDFRILNAIKYLWRYKSKGKPVADLQKAVWYIERVIEDAHAKVD